MNAPPSVAFAGDVVVITGSGRGLGRAYAEHLLGIGARVVVNDIDDDVAHDAARALGRDAAVACAADVAGERGAASVVAAALHSFGRLDAVVCNAGGSSHRPFVDITEDDLRAMVGPHLFGTFWTIRSAWPHFVAQGHGRVVTTSSDGFFGYASRGHYAAAKGAVIGLTNTVAVEGAAHGIGANTVMPYGSSRLSTPNAPYTDPALAAPPVAWLCHRDCTATGQTFLTGGDRFERVVYERRSVEIEGPGTPRGR